MLLLMMVMMTMTVRRMMTRMRIRMTTRMIAMTSGRRSQGNNASELYEAPLPAVSTWHCAPKPQCRRSPAITANIF